MNFATSERQREGLSSSISVRRDGFGEIIEDSLTAMAPRTKKDPNAPKKGLTDFMIFQQEHRAQVKEENPDASFGEIGKILGDMWKKLDADSKKEFKKRAEEDKARYVKEKAKYDSEKGGSDEEPEDEKPTKKRKKDPNHPRVRSQRTCSSIS